MITRRIGISLGDIGGLQDGLGEFSLQIGRRLAARAPLWAQRHGIAVDFHLRSRLAGLFGDTVGYLPVTRWQRFRHRSAQPYALWHSLHQLNKTLPPAGCAQRLVTVHDLNYLYGRNAFSTWRHHRRTQQLIARTDALATVSQYTAQDVRRHLGWTGEISVIPNGARSFADDPREPLPGWDRVPQRPFLLHLSRMSASKNPGAVLALAAAWPEMQFVLAGPAREDTRALAARTTLPNVQFHFGVTEAQKAWAYGACAGFVFPSFTEGFGLPPLEAMHFGKPVFLSRLTSLPEVGGELAFYVDDFAGPAMRRVVEHGLALHAADPARAEAVRRHAAQFSWDRAAQAYARLYARLLQLPEDALDAEPSEHADAATASGQAAPAVGQEAAA